MTIEVYEDENRLAEAAARLVAHEARAALERQGSFSLALAGGSTPRATYQLLTEPPLTATIPWEHVHVFWGDERCVDTSDPRSNERMARLTLLDHVPVPARQIHPMRCGAPEATGAAAQAAARAAAARYERLLRSVCATGLDLVLLGLGEDGHTASLFPGSAAVAERERWVVEASARADVAGGGPSPAGREAAAGTWRVTLTVPFINRARRVVFLVAGASKRAAVKRVLGGGGDEGAALPAQLIRPASGGLVWMLDEEAAALLGAAVRDRDRAPAATAAGAESQEGLP